MTQKWDRLLHSGTVKVISGIYLLAFVLPNSDSLQNTEKSGEVISLCLRMFVVDVLLINIAVYRC